MCCLLLPRRLIVCSWVLAQFFQSLYDIKLRMFYVFLMYVSSRCWMYFIWMLHILQLYVLNVSSILHVCCKCFIYILHMLQWLYTYVASICFKWFICFRRMLQVFYLDVAYVTVAIHLYCNCIFKYFTCFKHMLQQVFHVTSVFIIRPSMFHMFIWMLYMFHWIL
jgi:hypothetical protein